jgi:hypothetical protein
MKRKNFDSDGSGSSHFRLGNVMNQEWVLSESEDDLAWRLLMEYASEKQTADKE